jgi:hypothetical protein
MPRWLGKESREWKVESRWLVLEVYRISTRPCEGRRPGSIPGEGIFYCGEYFRRGGRTARRLSAKQLQVGSTPTLASLGCHNAAMDKQPRSRTPLITALVLFLLPVIYVGSYLALVDPPGNSYTASNRKIWRQANYHLRGRTVNNAAERIFWPLEQVDYKLRPKAWGLKRVDD